MVILFYYLIGWVLKKGSFSSLRNDDYELGKQKVKEKEAMLEYLWKSSCSNKKEYFKADTICLTVYSRQPFIFSGFHPLFWDHRQMSSVFSNL